MTKAVIKPLLEAVEPPAEPLRGILPYISDKRIIAYAFIVKEEIVAVGGYKPLWSGMGEGYLFRIPDIPPYVFCQMRDVWREITRDLKRVQMRVNIRRPMDIRFAYNLGMEPEGIQRKAGPVGEDYIVFARVK